MSLNTADQEFIQKWRNQTKPIQNNEITKIDHFFFRFILFQSEAYCEAIDMRGSEWGVHFSFVS